GMKDVQLLLLNSASSLAGVGEVAEIYVRSPFLAKGYLGLPEATREKFLVNPFTGHSWDLLYKTGDIGRYMPNGAVECAGRADDQVKIRGFRIELGEISAHLSKHEYVKETITIVSGHAAEPDQMHIVSYVVPAVLPVLNEQEYTKTLRE